MFKIKHIKEVCADPISSICDIGKFDGPATTYGDLVFVREGIDGIRTYMNSIVFRELLLSNPDLVLASTGIICLNGTEYHDLKMEIVKLKKENESLNAQLAAQKKKSRVNIGGVK